MFRSTMDTTCQQDHAHRKSESTGVADPAANRYNIYVDPWDHQKLTWKSLGPEDGALVRPDGLGYPVRAGVVRFLATQNPADEWTLRRMGITRAPCGSFQDPTSVESFGFQWTWDNTPRTDEDLLWRVATRFNLTPSDFAGKRVLDAGCGAGAQSMFLVRSGAIVSAIDLSSAIDSAARISDLKSTSLAQGDIAHLPFADGTFDIVYCEGVLQHAQATEPILAEFFRILKPGGLLLATHYVQPKGLPRIARWKLQEWIRRQAQKVPRDWLFLSSGIAAAIALTPGLGWVLRKSIVPSNDKMPSLKATWSNCYDSYGHHEFQRIIPPDEFVNSVRKAGFIHGDTSSDGLVRVTK